MSHDLWRDRFNSIFSRGLLKAIAITVSHDFWRLKPQRSIIFSRQRSAMAKYESRDQFSLLNEYIAIFIRNKATKNRKHEDS